MQCGGFAGKLCIILILEHYIVDTLRFSKCNYAAHSPRPHSLTYPPTRTNVCMAFKAEGTEREAESRLLRKLLKNQNRLIDSIRQMDVDRDGVISTAEFRAAVVAMNVGLTDRQVETLIRSIDVDNDGELDMQVWDSFRPRDRGDRGVPGPRDKSSRIERRTAVVAHGIRRTPVQQSHCCVIHAAKSICRTVLANRSMLDSSSIRSFSELSFGCAKCYIVRSANRRRQAQYLNHFKTQDELELRSMSIPETATQEREKQYNFEHATNNKMLTLACPAP